MINSQVSSLSTPHSLHFLRTFLLTCFVKTFCGRLFWTHFVTAYFGNLLWTLFVDTFCGHFFVHTYVDTLYEYFFSFNVLPPHFCQVWYRCYFPHQSRDSVSPVHRILLNSLIFLAIKSY